MTDLAAGTAGGTNPFAPEHRADPYSVYRHLRDHDPVHWDEEQEAYLCTRYSDCVDLLRSPGVSVDATKSTHAEERRATVQGANLAFEARPMLFMDPPDHTRLRGLVNKAFTPRRVEGLRPDIEKLVDGLLDGLTERGEIDVIADIAFPLPVIVIAQLMGIPLEDGDQLKVWSKSLARTIDPVVSEEVAQQAMFSGLSFINYLNELIDQRRKDPGPDLLSALITAQDERGGLSHQELVVNCILLFIAGHETTQNLIGNGMLALMRNPDQRRRLTEDPDLIKGAVEEMLRYDGPVQLTARHLLEDTEVSGRRIAGGETAILLLAAANRDPDQWADPDRFLVTRPDANRHIGFGNGIHFCLGAPLARVEAQATVSAMLRRLGDLELVEEMPPYTDNFTLRGLARLPLRFRPTS